jgi:uncharacterized protein
VKLVPAAVLGTAGLRFGFTGLYELTNSSGWQDAAGIVGLLLCVLALYAALAMAIEDSRGRTVLPLLRRGTGRGALEQRFSDQASGLDHEAGVREQL